MTALPKVHFTDADGNRQEVELNAAELYRGAHDASMSPAAYLNTLYPTAANDATAFEQFCAEAGLVVGKDRRYALRPASMEAILNGTRTEAGVIVREAVPASRILFPAFQMAALEDKLVEDRSRTANAFNGMVAVDDTINHDRYERAILNFSKPESARSRTIAPLSEPTSMLTVTASDQSYRITGVSLGMEVDNAALKSVSLELITKGMARQAEVETALVVDEYIRGFLNGDVDLGMAALSSVTGAVATAQSFDGTISAAGVLTQKAWVHYLFNNATKRTIDYIITDLNGALAIENRTGRPNVQGDNPNSKRIDTLENVISPLWPDQVKIFITTDPAWPANTLLGFDSRYGIHRVTSTTLAYAAAEEYAMRRSTKYRVDYGQVAYRLFDDAWNVLTLTV